MVRLSTIVILIGIALLFVPAPPVASIPVGIIAIVIGLLLRVVADT